ncbi:MAG: hypothetical protein WCI46_04360 [Verrucomicrobiota bacterium]
MKAPSLFIASALVLIFSSACVQDQPRRSTYTPRSVPRSPTIGTPEWLTWVDHHVDTRYASGPRAEMGSQEWYAIVDYQVFRGNKHLDYYPSGRHDRRTYRKNDPQYVDLRRTYRVGTIEWKNAVTQLIINKQVAPPPPLSDPWDAPLAPNH